MPFYFYLFPAFTQCKTSTCLKKFMILTYLNTWMNSLSFLFCCFSVDNSNWFFFFLQSEIFFNSFNDRAIALRGSTIPWKHYGIFKISVHILTMWKIIVIYTPTLLDRDYSAERSVLGLIIYDLKDDVEVTITWHL